jgi:hypothetical protein
MDLVIAQKFICGFFDAESSTVFVFHTDCVARGQDYKLIAHNYRVEVRKCYFSQRLVNVWNSLPINADCLTSLSCFQSFFS